MKIPVEKVPVAVPGFRFAGVHCGLKEGGKRDVALIVSDVPATAAGAFTTNLVKAAPVIVSAARVRSGRAQAILVNSGNANAYTGRDGIALARQLCALVARALGIPENLVLPSSTGRIGVPLPRARIRRGVRLACRGLSPGAFHEALEGIMTTDAFPKFCTETVLLGEREVTLAGMAKGAGMIAPRMQIVGAAHATALSYVVTDACVSHAALKRALEIALPESFNAVVVDGDTSTNDTILLLANGVAGNATLTPRSKEFPIFAGAVSRILQHLARLLVVDGEGATKLVEVVVRGGRTRRDAERVADAIARSPLCKAAFYGGDPYTGRIVCAAGYSGASFDPGRLDVFLNDLCVVRRGREIITEKLERKASAVVRRNEFALTLHLHAGNAVARRLTSDLSVDYVRFNSDYRT